MDSVRRPAVAGTFYRGDPRSLRAEVEDCFTRHLGPGAVPTVDPDGPHLVRALLCPHAGFQYSGPAAAWAYAELARDGPPDVIVMLGPNHTGMGEAVAITGADAWSTPLGEVPIEAGLRRTLLAEFPLAREDDAAHRFEHSLEVQLPFIQYLFGGDAPILPIALRAVSASAAASAETLRLSQLGQVLAEALRGRRGVVIASSDMTHFEPHDAAVEKDRAALDRALALDAGELLRGVDAGRVSMCGVLPAATSIYAATATGARQARLLAHYTSGDVTGDKREVVGYAAMSFLAEAA